jgi:hypothetical protein
MQMILKADQIQLTKMPNGVDGTKNVKMYLKDFKCTIYMSKEVGEKDYTGFGKGRGGIAYRAHLVRNGNAPYTPVVQVQDDPQEKEYKILMKCLDERGLPLVDAKSNETRRVPTIVFDTAQECAEYEEHLIRTYEEDVRPIYEIVSWQDGSIEYIEYDKPVELEGM